MYMHVHVRTVHVHACLLHVHVYLCFLIYIVGSLSLSLSPSPPLPPPPSALGQIRTTVCQARLLVRSKLKQYLGLVEGAEREGGEGKTTAEDLQASREGGKEAGREGEGGVNEYMDIHVQCCIYTHCARAGNQLYFQYR